MTAAVGWAVVGPRGKVYAETVTYTRKKTLEVAAWEDMTNFDSGRLNTGYRLARVRIEVIEVIEESDDE